MSFVTPVTSSLLGRHACEPNVYAGCDTVTPVTPYTGERTHAHVTCEYRCHTSHRWNTLIISKA